jgi:hypothetical protein
MNLGISFVIENTGLLSMTYNGVSAFGQLIEDWTDPVYLEQFFEEHENDLLYGFYAKNNISINEAIRLTAEKAREFQALFYEVAIEKKGGETLESLFLPYHQHANVQSLNLEKSKLDKFPNWFRIYAIRVDPNHYVITGGTIKLTASNQERSHTLEEHNKLIRARDFLIQEELFDKDAIYDFVEL